MAVYQMAKRGGGSILPSIYFSNNDSSVPSFMLAQVTGKVEVYNGNNGKMHSCTVVTSFPYPTEIEGEFNLYRGSCKLSHDFIVKGLLATFEPDGDLPKKGGLSALAAVMNQKPASYIGKFICSYVVRMQQGGKWPDVEIMFCDSIAEAWDAIKEKGDEGILVSALSEAGLASFYNKQQEFFYSSSLAKTLPDYVKRCVEAGKEPFSDSIPF